MSHDELEVIRLESFRMPTVGKLLDRERAWANADPAVRQAYLDRQLEQQEERRVRAGSWLEQGMGGGVEIPPTAEELVALEAELVASGARRVKVLRLPSHLLVRLLEQLAAPPGETGRRRCVLEGLPQGCRFAGIDYRLEWDEVLVRLEHESFPLVTAGCTCEQLVVTARELPQEAKGPLGFRPVGQSMRLLKQESWLDTTCGSAFGPIPTELTIRGEDDLVDVNGGPLDGRRILAASDLISCAEWGGAYYILKGGVYQWQVPPVEVSKPAPRLEDFADDPVMARTITLTRDSQWLEPTNFRVMLDVHGGPVAGWKVPLVGKDVRCTAWPSTGFYTLEDGAYRWQEPSPSPRGEGEPAAKLMPPIGLHAKKLVYPGKPPLHVQAQAEAEPAEATCPQDMASTKISQEMDDLTELLRTRHVPDEKLHQLPLPPKGRVAFPKQIGGSTEMPVGIPVSREVADSVKALVTANGVYCPRGHHKLEGDCRDEFCSCRCSRCREQCARAGR